MKLQKVTRDQPQGDSRVKAHAAPRGQSASPADRIFHGDDNSLPDSRMGTCGRKILRGSPIQEGEDNNVLPLQADSECLTLSARSSRRGRVRLAGLLDADGEFAEAPAARAVGRVAAERVLGRHDAHHCSIPGSQCQARLNRH